MAALLRLAFGWRDTIFGAHEPQLDGQVAQNLVPSGQCPIATPAANRPPPAKKPAANKAAKKKAAKKKKAKTSKKPTAQKKPAAQEKPAGKSAGEVEPAASAN